MEYEDYLIKLEKVKQVDTLDDYFYHKSSRSNSPYKFEDITFSLLTKSRYKSPVNYISNSPVNSRNNSKSNSPILKAY